MQRLNNRLSVIEKQIEISTDKGIRHFIGILHDGLYSISYNGTWKGQDCFKEKPLYENIPGLIDGSLEEYEAYKALYMVDPVDDLLIRIVSNE